MAEEPAILQLNLLLSAQVVKFLGLKPSEITKLKDWGDWDGEEHHWFSNWRIEDYCGVTGKKSRILVVTNQVSKYTVFIDANPKDIKYFFKTLHNSLMELLYDHKAYYPPRINLQVMTLSGSARSISAFQNEVRYMLDSYLERHEVLNYEEAKKHFNLIPTSCITEGDSYDFPIHEFERLCKEQPPFGTPENIIPFSQLN